MNLPVPFLFRFLNRFRVRGKSNHIKAYHADVKYSDFLIRGNRNEFHCKSLLKHAGIMIKGNNNIITIGEGGELRNLRLWIVGHNCRISIGDNVIFNGGRVVAAGEANTVKIGDECMFAEGIEIWGSDTHPVYRDGKIINPSLSIDIGEKVWLGTRAMVLKGSKIGEGAIVGMASLVKGDIPPYSMAVGNPARVIKENVEWDNTEIKC